MMMDEQLRIPELSQDEIQAIEDAYRATIPDKMLLLQQLIDAHIQKASEETFNALYMLIHKIAGSAGTYGYTQVSTLCKELLAECRNKKEFFIECSEEVRHQLGVFLKEIKKGFYGG